MSKEITQVNDINFESEVIKSDKSILVCFGGTWCGPCNRQLPILEQVAASNPTLKIVKVDIDDSPDVASKYGVRSVPTLMLFRDGVKVDSKVGLTPANAITAMVSQ